MAIDLVKKARCLFDCSSEGWRYAIKTGHRLRRQHAGAVQTDAVSHTWRAASDYARSIRGEPS